MKMTDVWKVAKLAKDVNDFFEYDEESANLENFLAWCKKEYPQIVAEYDLTKGVQI
jgi:hypothetical protein